MERRAPRPDRAAFERGVAEILESLASVEGWMKPREVEALCLFAGCPTADGDVLEIGSYRGRSTIALAKAAAWCSDGRVAAVDPLPDTGPMSPDERGRPSARARMEANLSAAGVRDRVDLYAMRSQELAPRWDRPLRFLWIDGDHSYAGAKSDFDGFAPHLADGAILALHDVLNYYEGSVRVFAEDVLLSPHFGAAGVVGSIGWAQYFADPADSLPHRAAKRRLLARVQRLVPHVAYGTKPRGGARLAFRLGRALVPHGRIDPERWASAVADRRGARAALQEAV